MKNDKSNFKTELVNFLKQAPYEITIAILLGALPVAFYATNAQAFDNIVGELLASGALINYSGYLFIPYGLATLLRWAMRFKSEGAQKKLVFLHKITTEIGTSFLTIIRTGLGTMIGILLVALFTNIVTLTFGDYIGLIGSAFCVLIVSSGLAVFHAILSKASSVQKENNPLKFDRRLMQ